MKPGDLVTDGARTAGSLHLFLDISLTGRPCGELATDSTALVVAVQPVKYITQAHADEGRIHEGYVKLAPYHDHALVIGPGGMGWLQAKRLKQVGET